MKIYDFKQGSQEWLDIRKGKMTASHACEIGNNGKGLDTCILNLMAEKYSRGEKPQYSNEDMERGKELEDQARSLYAIENGAELKQVGFIEYSEFVGCSPDGLVGEDGGVEIKCPSDAVYFQHLLNGEKAIDSKYVWQIQMNLLITGRKWWDYVAYNPNFEKSIFIKRILPDEEVFKKLKIGFEIGEEKIKSINKMINK
jgi:putative phage-type endonuclease